MSNARRGLPLTSSRIEKIFPKLTAEQIRRISAHERMRSVQPGEVLIERTFRLKSLVHISSLQRLHDLSATANLT